MENPSTERAVYKILQRRAVVADLSYSEFFAAATAVVAKIPLNEITPIEEIIARVEVTVLSNRSRN
jgi:hypothetical protein